MSHIDGVDDGVGYGGIYYKTTIHIRVVGESNICETNDSLYPNRFAR
ncbi:MAG: hypothetical protein WA395_14435 [Nitrososphaeraceae archaeon]